MESSRAWIAPFTGVAFVIVVVISAILGGSPPTANDSSAQEIVTFYTDNSGSVEFGAALGGIAATLFVFFAATLRQVFRQAEGADRSILPSVVLGGALVVAAGVGLDGSLSFALAEAGDQIDPTAIQALQAFWDNDFLTLAIALQLFFLGVGLSILRYGVFPKWIGWIALVIGVVAVTPIGFFAFLVGAIVIAVMSVMLALRSRPPARPATA